MFLSTLSTQLHFHGSTPLPNQESPSTIFTASPVLKSRQPFRTPPLLQRKFIPPFLPFIVEKLSSIKHNLLSYIYLQKKKNIIRVFLLYSYTIMQTLVAVEKLALRVYQHLSISLSSNSLPRVFLWSYIKANMIFLFLKWYIEFLTDFKIACSKMSSLLVSNEIPMACFKEKQNVNYTLTKWQCMFWLQIFYVVLNFCHQKSCKTNNYITWWVGTSLAKTQNIIDVLQYAISQIVR